MGDPVIDVESVVIDVVDDDQRKALRGAVLGSEVAQEFPLHFCWFAPQHEGGISVALQAVEHPTEGPRRLHLDAVVDDVGAAKAKIIELGGSVLADREMAGFHGP